MNLHAGVGVAQHGHANMSGIIQFADLNGEHAVHGIAGDVTANDVGAHIVGTGVRDDRVRGRGEVSDRGFDIGRARFNAA